MSTMPIPRRKAMPINPVPVGHWRNFVWWLILVVAVIAVHELPKFLVDAVPPSGSASLTESGMEKEAFTALVFGKVSATHELSISTASFKAQLTGLKQAGYSSVRLEQINRWKQTDTASLPAKPVLLTFEEANRETMEIADDLLAALGMTALVFVDSDLLDQANINLVSWHKLELMAKSGRWEVGISGCANGDDQAFNSPALLAEKLARQRKLLEQRLQVPIVTADCSRAWNPEQGDGAVVWAQALKDAAIPTGFVAAPFGANYRNDPESGFRRIRVSRTWGQADILAQLNNHAPRRAAFVDQFQSGQAASAWVVDNGEITVSDGKLRIFNMSGEKGALVTLSGTEKWQDADVEVRLKGQPEGQFWMSLRHGTSQPSVRLGMAEGRVILQESDGAGMYRQLASRDAPSGDVTLKLHVVGARAIGYLNGQALLTRPIAIPDGADHGAFALAVWNKDAETGTIEAGQASVNLVKVSATPLFSKGGIIAPSPGKEAWVQLRQQSEELSMISPSYFSWLNGKPNVSAVNNITVEIFARFHHLKFLPSVYISEGTLLSDQAPLTRQILTWAMDPAYDGLNIVVNKTMAKNGWRLFLSDLNLRMSKAGKALTVTLLQDGNDPFATETRSDNLLLVAAPLRSFTGLAKIAVSVQYGTDAVNARTLSQQTKCIGKAASPRVELNQYRKVYDTDQSLGFYDMNKYKHRQHGDYALFIGSSSAVGVNGNTDNLLTTVAKLRQISLWALLVIAAMAASSTRSSAAGPRPPPLGLTLVAAPSVQAGQPLDAVTVRLVNPGAATADSRLRVFVHDREDREIGINDIKIDIQEGNTWNNVKVEAIDGGVMGAVGAPGKPHDQIHNHGGFHITHHVTKIWQLRLTFRLPGLYSVVAAISPDNGATHLAQPAKLSIEAL